MYRLNENDPNIYIPTEVHEDLGFEDYQFSSNSMVPNGYSFERGPYIYSVEAEGTTYYYQNAVPVFRYEDSSSVEYQYCSNSMVPNSYYFERGQYIYTVEEGGTIYYYQNAVAVCNFDRISGVPQSSNSYDVTHTLLSTSSYIMDNGNIDILMSNETVKKSEESKCSVKSDALCDVEENENVINSVEHEVYIISDETSDIETNTKVKQEDKKLKPELKHSLKNEDCVRNGNVSESEKELNLSSGKVDKVCNVDENKKMKRKLKKRKAKAIKPIAKKNSADKDEVCISQLIKKVTKMEELESFVKSSVKSDAICDVEENEKVIISVEHEVYIISDETSDVETNTKVKQEDKNVKPEVKHSLKNEDCVRNGNVSESKKELNLSSGKVDKVCNVEENKKMKRKLKKRKAKAIKPIEKKNSADKDEVCISQLIKKVTKMEEHESFVKIDETHDVNNSVELKIYKKINKKRKKTQSNVKESVDIKESVKGDEAYNLDLTETSQKSEKQRISVKSDECCYLNVNRKELSDSNEVGDSEQDNKKKRKKKKRKSNVKESIEIKECVKIDEVYNLDLKGKFQKSEKQRTSVKSDERCYSKVNGKESSVFNEVSNGKSEKKKKRKRKSKKKKSKGNFDEHQAIDTESVYVKEHSNLDSSDKDVLLAEIKEKTAITTDNFAKSSDVTVVVKYDTIKTVDSFPVMMNDSSDFNEVDVLKTAKEEQEKSKSKLSSTVESPYENNNSICKLSEPKSICVEGKVKLNSVNQDTQKSNSSRSSSIDHFHSHINSIFELYPKSVCNNENVQFNYFDQSIKTLKESVSSTKTEELPDRNFHVPSQQSTSHLALPDTRTDLPCEDLSKATSSSEIKKKKKRFQKLRKWLTDLCCCMRKDNE